MLVYNYEVNPNATGKPTNLIPTVQIQVKLLNTPFVKRWMTYLVNLSDRVPNIGWYMTSQASNERNIKLEEMIPSLTHLYNSFAYFHEHKIEDFTDIINELTYLLQNPASLTQHHLNTYHRWFTEFATRFFVTKYKQPPTCNEQELFTHVHNVNGYVHNLEQYTYYDLERRRIFPVCKQWSTQAHNAHNLNNLQNGIWDEMVWLESGTYDFFNESYDHTVWLHEDIQGKDQLKAWMDHDILDPEDITGNLFMTPNVTFDPYKLYKTIMDRDDFRQESSATGKTLDKPPLGDIVNIDEVPWEHMVHYRVTSITLSNITLWSLQNVTLL